MRMRISYVFSPKRLFQHSCLKVTVCLLKSLSLAASKGQCPTGAEVGRAAVPWPVVGVSQASILV